MKPRIILTILTGLALALGLGACSTAPTKPAPTPAAVAAPALPSPSPSPTGEPQTYDGAKAAVDRLDQASATHNGGALWDMLTASGQAAITRADYTKIVAGCPTFAGEKTLSIAMNPTNTIATVTELPAPGQGSDPYTWSLVYENGHWKHQPSDGAMKWMAMGATNAIAYLKQGGAC